MSIRISANICRDTATSASFEGDVATVADDLLARSLISFSRRLVSDHGFAAFGIASLRMKLPRL